MRVIASQKFRQLVDPVVGDPVRQDNDKQPQAMNIEKFCPLSLCTLIGNFRIYLYRAPQSVGNF